MRHKKLNKRLGRNKSQRKQLIRSLTRALFQAYKIETTVEKAKEARKMVEKIVTYAKSGQLKDIRAMESVLQDRALVSNIVKVVAPLAKKRKGGYTRITRSGFRRGDGASLAILELTDMPVVEKKTKKHGKQKSAPQTTPSEDIKTKKKVPPKADEHTVKKEKAGEEKKAELPKKEAKKSAGKDESKEGKAKEIEKAGKPESLKEQKSGDRFQHPKGKKDGLFGKFKGYFKKDK